MKQYIKRTKSVKIEVIINVDNIAQLWIWNGKHSELTQVLELDTETAIKLTEKLHISAIRTKD